MLEVITVRWLLRMGPSGGVAVAINLVEAGVELVDHGGVEHGVWARLLTKHTGGTVPFLVVSVEDEGTSEDGGWRWLVHDDTSGCASGTRGGGRDTRVGMANDDGNETASWRVNKGIFILYVRM